MREYTILIVPTDNPNRYQFQVTRHGEIIYECTACLMPGLAAINHAMAENLSGDPL